MLSVLRFVGFLMIAGSIGLGVDFARAMKGRDDYTLKDHIVARIAELPIPGLQQTVLEASLPKAPEGWSHREGRYDDRLLIDSGAVDKAAQVKLAEFEDLLGVDVPGYDVARGFMQRGYKMVSTQVTFFPANTLDLQTVNILELQLAKLLSASSPIAGPDVGGLQFLRITKPEKADMTYYLANLDNRLYVSLYTNLDPVEAEQMLQGFDAAALVEFVAKDITLGAPLLKNSAKSATAKAMGDAGKLCVRRAGVLECDNGRPKGK